MIGLDTNVLVRYIAQDDEKQPLVATTLIEGLSVTSPGFVSLVSLVKLVGVMQSCYKAAKQEILSILDMLLRTPELSIENTETAMQAASAFGVSTADFADCVIAQTAHKAGCRYTATFDVKAATLASMRLL